MSASDSTLRPSSKGNGGSDIYRRLEQLEETSDKLSAEIYGPPGSPGLKGMVQQILNYLHANTTPTWYAPVGLGLGVVSVCTIVALALKQFGIL